jgi:integrase
MRSCSWTRKVQELLGHKDIQTTMISYADNGAPRRQVLQAILRIQSGGVSDCLD